MNPWQGILWLAGLQADFEIVEAQKFNREKRLVLTLRRIRKEGRCSDCGHLCSRIHSVDEVTLRDLSSFGYQVWLKIPRFTVRCPRCGKNRVEDHWLWRERRRFTWRYESHISAMCEEMTNLSCARLEGLPDTTVYNIDFELLKLRIERQILPELGPHYSMDEVYFHYFPDQDPRKPTSFVTNLVCLKHRKVVLNAPGRNQASAEACLLGLSSEQRAGMQSIATDLHDAFHLAVRKHCPGAKIVLDRFHIMKLFNEAMNDFRKRQVHLTTDLDEKRLLQGKHKWILLKNTDSLSHKDRDHLDELKQLNERIIEALLIREHFVSFFESSSEETARTRWLLLMALVEQAGIQEFTKFFSGLKKWLGELWDYFKHRTSSAVIEALNHKIKATKAAAYGYRNLYYFRLKILQRVGFLNTRFATLPTRRPLHAG
jgi:transposase